MLKKLLLIVCIVVLVEIHSQVNACSCIFRSNNAKFCDADYVIKAKVKNKVAVGMDFKHKIRTKSVYKASAAYNALSGMSKKKVWTANNSAACGVNLTVGSVYLLAGSVYNGKMYINSCQWVEKWSDLSSQEKYNVKNVYGQGANCAICCNGGIIKAPDGEASFE